MNRRQFVLTTAGALASAKAQSPDSGVKRVLAMFKCHLDVGFIDTQAAVVQKYFKQYFPAAIRLGEALRNAGGDRYVWTTGSWLLYEYLEQAHGGERKRMESAVAAGDIAWHALPFTWQSELLDPTAIAGGIGFSKSLDRRFGRKTTGAKMTDVPGHTRGLIAPLAANGVTFLNIGVNSASTPPDVPELFVWKEPGGSTIVMMYHRLAYGGVVKVPGSDLAIAVEMADDNAGPHSLEEIRKIYADLRAQFPHATIQASNLTEIANAVVEHKTAFPVVTQEIGDTWIYGMASDPVKLARFRELLRLRREWIDRSRLHVADKTDLAFLSKFLLGAEHTWGTDTKTWLDFEHYAPDALASMLAEPKYKTVTNSWLEKRADIDQAVAILPAALRNQATSRLARLKPMRPETSGLKPLDPSYTLETEHFAIRLDAATGAIIQLRSKRRNRDWASAEHPLGVFRYQTLSKADYDRFLASYITVQTDWAPKDFGKPGIEKFGAVSKVWGTRLVDLLTGEDSRELRLVAKLAVDGAATEATAWPSDVYMEMVLPKSPAAVEINLSWFGKRANRLPEALWFSFAPDAPQANNWALDILGEAVSPFDTVSGGNRHMHAISKGLSYRDDAGGLELDSLDAALVVLGEMSPIYFSNSQPDLSAGIHFSLFNNGWGTNYIQWFGEDMRFRFRINDV
jgi:hypothetical protein